MTHSIRRIWLWSSLTVIALLTVVALWVSGQVSARAPLSAGNVVSTVVTPGREATLTSPDERVTITFPTNFFSVTLVVTYTERIITDLPANLVQIGPAFMLEAVRASDNQPVTVYEIGGCPTTGEPTSKDQCVLPGGGCEIAFHYADDEITSASISSNTLALAYHYTPNGTHGKWLPLNTVIDDRSMPVGNQSLASTWYFAHFALLGIAPPVPIANTGQVEVIVDDLADEFTQYQVPGSADYWWHYWSEGGTYNGHSYYTKNSDLSHGRQNWGTWTPPQVAPTKSGPSSRGIMPP